MSCGFSLNTSDLNSARLAAGELRFCAALTEATADGRVVVINETIAVAIDPITVLVLIEGKRRLAGTLYAPLTAREAGACPTGTLSTTHREVVLVDLPIAVIVDPVAALIRWRGQLCSLTSAIATIDARSEPPKAAADPLSLWGTVEARERGDLLVNASVTVPIEAVTALRLRRRRAPAWGDIAARGLHGDTLDKAAPADPLRLAGFPNPEPLIDHPITVLIEAATALRLRGRRAPTRGAAAAQLSRLIALKTTSAADPSRFAERADIEALIDRAVAVVVACVAALFSGKARAPLINLCVKKRHALLQRLTSISGGVTRALSIHLAPLIRGGALISRGRGHLSIKRAQLISLSAVPRDCAVELRASRVDSGACAILLRSERFALLPLASAEAE